MCIFTGPLNSSLAKVTMHVTVKNNAVDGVVNMKKLQQDIILAVDLMKLSSLWQ